MPSLRTTVRSVSESPVKNLQADRNDSSGSLIARIVFQPLEETARLYFSKSISPNPSSSSSDSSGSSASSHSSLLTTLLRFSTHLLLLLPAFGPPLLPTLLPILLPWPPSRLSTPLRILQVYTVYLPLLSLNGMLEAFFAAFANPSLLAQQSRAMVLFSAAFVGCAWVGASWWGRPEEGLVWANCVNMTGRIGFTFWATRGWLERQEKGGRHGLSVRGIRPSWEAVAAVGAAAVVIRASARWAEGKGLKAQLAHVALGAVLGLACLGVWSVFDLPPASMDRFETDRRASS